MYYKNNKKIARQGTFIFVLITVIVSLAGIGAVSAILTMQTVDAQMSSNNSKMSGSMMGSTSGVSSNSSSSGSSGGMGSNMMAVPAKAPVLNITTAAPPITPSMFKSMASQIHLDLTNATIIAEKWVGNNSHAVSSMVGIQNGSPVYTIWVVDSNSGLHQILVDPQNGRIMFANQPMSMTGPFS